jgi:hypothetical protein
MAKIKAEMGYFPYNRGACIENEKSIIVTSAYNE